MEPEIVSYIREHRDTYTREAITQHLLEAGHSQEAIDAAWWRTVDAELAAKEEVEAATAPEPPILGQPLFWLALVGYVFGVLALTNLFNIISLLFGLVFYAVALLVGFCYPIFRFDRNRAVALGMLCGFAIVVVLLFVAPGLCTLPYGDLTDF